jgi:predicted nucleic acid-binding protein
MILLDTDVMIDVDSLIAETVAGLGVPLATFNDKHYRVVGGLQLLEPYSRFP